MASGFFAILDDVASLLDDVAVAAKLATRKTAGILGDDLAVNAEKATGFLASRELPVLWAITKGSFINKLIIVPIALILTAFSPFAIKMILILGGFYLAYEGAEKIVEYLFHRKKKGTEIMEQAREFSEKVEKLKIKSAITTDFILSVEIVVIAAGTVLEESILIQIVTVSIVSILATVGVYGIVALIVRMDDFGFKLIKQSPEHNIFWKTGHLLVKSLPVIIKLFSFVGTVALLLVSGGIFLHNIHFLHDLLSAWPLFLREFLGGLVTGLIVVGIVKVVKPLFLLRRLRRAAKREREKEQEKAP